MSVPMPRLCQAVCRGPEKMSVCTCALAYYLRSFCLFPTQKSLHVEGSSESNTDPVL